MIYIFILILPFSFSYLTDVKSGISPVIHTRTGIKSYYYTKLASCFIGSFIVFFIPLIISIIINGVLFPLEGTLHDSVKFLYGHTAGITGDNVAIKAAGAGVPFKWLYIHHPQWYNVLYSCIFSSFAGILGAFVYSLSFLIKKFRILLMLPLFILVFIQQRIGILIRKYSDVYVNVDMSDYVMTNSFHGKSAALFVIFIMTIVICTVILVHKKARSDQLF